MVEQRRGPLYGPWKCVRCGRICESTERSAAVVSEGGPVEHPVCFRCEPDKVPGAFWVCRMQFVGAECVDIFESKAQIEKSYCEAGRDEHDPDCIECGGPIECAVLGGE